MTQTIIKVPAAGAFDPTDITITDDTSGAFLIKEGSNEYMRINTTNGSEQMVLKGRPGSAPNAALYLTDQPYLQGTSGQFIQMNSSGVGIQSGSAGRRLDVFVTNTGNGFRVVGTGNAERFKVLDDSNANFTLDGGSANYFTVKNDVSANHIFRVNGQTRHTEIERIGFAGTQYFGYAADYCQRSQPAAIDYASHTTSPTTLAVPDMGGSPGSGTFNSINKRTAIRVHSASQSASGDLFTATLNVSDSYDQLIREMFLYVSNYDSTNNFALKIQASAGSGNWRELNSSGITSASGQTIDAATTYIYRIFQYAPGGSTATRVYGINFMGKMAH